MKKKHKPICPSNDWSIKDLETTWEVVQEINNNKYQIDHFPARFELISFEGMLSAYSTVALPGLFDHWSFGKSYVEEEAKYRETHNLAFEVVINSNPSVCYLMDSNTYATQALVIAHAAIGHSGFFKNNHLFKTHTKADRILPFLSRSAERIRELEISEGEEWVEDIIDACNSIKYNSYDKHPVKSLSAKETRAKNEEAARGRESRVDKILDFTLSGIDKRSRYTPTYGPDVVSSSTNVLKFIRDNSVNASPEAREIMTIMLELNQYLYPQVHTQLMNEGFASFTHYSIMQDMYDLGYITEGQYWEFIKLHCSVLMQRGIKEGNVSINPYKLGFDMYKDIKRICLEPTDEDKIWFPEYAGNPDWVGEIKRAAYGYKDESFISQYLSPKVIRDYKFLHIRHDFEHRQIVMEDTHDEIGYGKIINQLSKQYDFFNKVPPMTAFTTGGQKEKLRVNIIESDSRKVHMDNMESVQVYIEILWEGRVEVDVIFDDKDVQ